MQGSRNATYKLTDVSEEELLFLSRGLEFYRAQLERWIRTDDLSEDFKESRMQDRQKVIDLHTALESLLP